MSKRHMEVTDKAVAMYLSLTLGIDLADVRREIVRLTLLPYKAGATTLHHGEMSIIMRQGQGVTAIFPRADPSERIGAAR